MRIRRHVFVEVAFTAKGLKPQRTDLTMEVAGPFEVVFPVVKLPATPAREQALRLIEEQAFDLVCDEADPSLQRLWQQQATGRGRPMPLRWVDGAPVAPRWYTVRRGNQWVTYRGRFHGPHAGTESPWVTTVVRGGQLLIATQHGLVLAEVAQPAAASSADAGAATWPAGAPIRHAWLYVSDFGIGKLRHPTVTNPRFEGDLAVVTFASPLSDDFEHSTRIEVSLKTGAVRVVTAKR